MSKKERISKPVMKRLPRYLRFMSELMEKDIRRISSKELSQRMGLTASQIRQDFNCFGGFGQQGYGYDVDKLHTEMSRILGVNNSYGAVLVGAGNLGRAIATHVAFGKVGFELIGIFDKNPQLTGTELGGLKIQSTDSLVQFCRERKPKAAFLCLPREGVEKTVEALIDCGVTAFWNFSHYDIAMNYPDKDVIVENVHMNDSLMTLCYQITAIEHPYTHEEN